MDIPRHKVFISYYHLDDQQYKNNLTELKYYKQYFGFESVFDDYSVGIGDIDDEDLTDEQIRIKIRDEYISDATVLVLLCGKNTKYRKHIDWEIHAAMYDSESNPQLGIIVINLPYIVQSSRISDETEKEIIDPLKNKKWVKFKNRSEFEEAYPYMPSRIIDNFVKDIPITVVDWNVVYNNPNELMRLIDNAFKRKKDLKYDHSALLRKNNSN